MTPSYEWCDGGFQAIVYNNSSHSMNIKGDHEDHPFQFHTRILRAGQNNVDDTDLCDADYLTFRGVDWWWFYEEYDAGEYSVYLWATDYECVNHWQNSDEGRCRYPG